VNVDALSAELLPDGDAPTVYEVLVERGSCRDASWKRRVVVGIANAQWAILQTELGYTDSQRASRVAHAPSHEDSGT